MPSAAAAGTSGGHDHRSGNDNDGSAVRLASAVGAAMKGRATATSYLDDHVGRSLAGASGKACAALPAFLPRIAIIESDDGGPSRIIP
jgi:hypothetical protein